MHDMNATQRNLAMLHDEIRRLGWLVKIRPQSLVEPLYRLLRSHPVRAIVPMNGLRLYVDPFTHHGRQIVSGVTYEGETIDMVRANLPANGVFLDVGANECVISSAAAAHLGADGLVVSVEPQSRLRDILEINLSLNSRCPYRIFGNAVTVSDGETVELNLRPSFHTGGTSIVNSYRWSRKMELVSGRSIDSIVASLGRPVDLMKVDVEGYEPEVIQSALQSLDSGRIQCLLVDYHASILQKRGLVPSDTDKQILARGYRRKLGHPSEGYVLYAAN